MRLAYFLTPFDVNESGRDRAAQNELCLAGIGELEARFKGEFKGGFKTTVLGVLWFKNGAVVAFSRDHSYWAVNSSVRLPYEQAKALNDRWANVVRAYGMSGGTDIERDGCANWHVDAQEGLNVLVQALTEHFGAVQSPSPSVSTLRELGLINDAVYC